MSEATRMTIDERLAAYLDGALDEAQMRALNDELREDAAARRMFVDACMQVRLTRERMLRQAMHEPGLIEPIFTVRRRWARPALAAAAMVMMCGLFVWMFTPNRPATEPATVAVLTYAEDAHWPDAMEPVRVGQEMTPRTISIDSGRAEIAMLSGANLIVEGPAELSLDSRMQVHVRRGRLTAYVPPQSVGFTVVTPTGRVIDRGTAFGVDVGGETNVQVFEGVVDAVTEHEGQTVTRALHASEQICMTKAGAIEDWKPAEPMHFIRELEARRLGVTNAYVNAVESLNPVGYWRFERIVDGQSPNEMSDHYAAQIVGKVTLVGPPGDRAAVFRPNRSDQYLYATEPLDGMQMNDYCVEFWVMPEWVHRGMLVEMTERSGEPTRTDRQHHVMAAELEDDATIRFLHRVPAGIEGGTNIYSARTYEPGKWHHVVAVKQGANMRFYLDGELTGIATDATNIYLDPYVSFGKLTDIKTMPYRRYFIGRLDEVAIYNRALSDEQIREHYQMIHHP
ncbi:MAG: hypothetical protein GC162_09340 [Planctomycetes bacterium]|nr:hypothetical protein [Planctomycetota bacterium]